MNAGTFDFSAMSTEELLRLVQRLAIELYNRCGPIKTLVVRTLKTVKSWLF